MERRKRCSKCYNEEVGSESQMELTREESKSTERKMCRERKKERYINVF